MSIMQIRRPKSNRFIRFFEETSEQMVYNLSTFLSPDVTFVRNVMNFTVNFKFTRGQRYYILMDSGKLWNSLIVDEREREKKE